MHYYTENGVCLTQTILRHVVVPLLTCHVNDSSLVGSATAMSPDILVILSVGQ